MFIKREYSKKWVPNIVCCCCFYDGTPIKMIDCEIITYNNISRMIQQTLDFC